MTANWKMKISSIILMLLLSLSAGFMIFSIFVFTYAYNVDQHNLNSEYTLEAGDIILTDTYDGENSSINDFFNKPESLKIMKNTYNHLDSSKKVVYYTVSTQDIAFIGLFRGSQELINGDGDSLNQKIGREVITPLKGIQVDKQFMIDKEINGMVKYGKSFASNDFNLDSQCTIPVVLGANYMSIFDLGESFKAYYLGDKKIKYKVIGFLSPESKLVLNYNEINLDNVVLSPSVNASPGDTDSFKKTLLSVHCNGIIHYKSEQNFNLAVSEMKYIKNKIGFKYEIPAKYLKNNNIFQISYRQSAVFMLLSFLTFLIIMIIAYNYIVCAIFKSRNKKYSSCKVCLSSLICMLTIFSLAYSMNCLIFSDYSESIIKLSINRIAIIFLIAWGILSISINNKQRSLR